ncbi:aldo-keto reductase 2 [Scenedesmus sp. PABB004]|nr:aldo-keto reductase 2 [Scenedesmus sp. PABB004]
MTIAAVPARPLGSQGLVASAQGLGCMGMTYSYTTKAGWGGDEESVATIHRALDLGVTMLDTSDIYGPFTNEELVGKAIAGRRERFVVATKCGIVKTDSGLVFDGSRAHVRAACEASLRRLGTDYIDLFYLHRVDPNTPVAETFAEMAALVAEGKVRYVGISEAAPEDIRAAHAVCPLSAVQMEWSLWSRDSERDLVPVCRELGIGIVAYSPLGRGFLSGSITRIEDLPEDDSRRNYPRYQGEAFAKNLELVNAVKAMAARKGCTAGQLALAWVAAQGDDVFTIPGTKRVKYLEENVGAVGVSLSADELRELEEICPADKVVGERYPDMKKFSYHYARPLSAAEL